MQAPESESGRRTQVSLLQEPHSHRAERSCTTLEGALPTSIQKVGATKGLCELPFTLSGSQARFSLSLQCRNLETWVWTGYWSLIGKVMARRGRCRHLALELRTVDLVWRQAGLLWLHWIIRYCVINLPNTPGLRHQVCLVGHCLADLS